MNGFARILATITLASVAPAWAIAAGVATMHVEMARAAEGTGLDITPRKYSIAEKAQKWKLAATVFDDKGETRVHVLYRDAGPWDSKDECVAFAKSDDAALDEALTTLLDGSIQVLGEEIKGVGTSCVSVKD